MTTAILLSGGMDSIALAWWCRPDVAITIDYGQIPAAAEIRAAKAAAHAMDMAYRIIKVDLKALGSGDLAGREASSLAPVREWWPFRNQMLVTLAAMDGIAIGVDRILIGAVAGDTAHADGRKEFVNALSAAMALQEGGVILDAPAIDLSAEDLVRRSGVPMDVLAWAHSCHAADYACGFCRGCHKHYHTMAALNVDPY